jgi:hypothetical protein
LSEIIAALPRAAVLGPSTAREFARPGGQSVLYDYESTAEPDTATVVVTPCARAFTIFDAETMVLTKSEIRATLSGGGRQAVPVFRNIEGRVDLTGVPRRREARTIISWAAGADDRGDGVPLPEETGLTWVDQSWVDGGLPEPDDAGDGTEVALDLVGRLTTVRLDEQWAATSGTAVQIHDDFWPR